MANLIKGEVALEFEGKPFKLLLDMNALAEFEDAAGCANAMALLQDPAKMGVKMTRALFWAALRAHHPELTLEDAGRILTANMDKLGEAMAAAFPVAEPGNPPPAGKKRAI